MSWSAAKRSFSEVEARAVGAQAALGVGELDLLEVERRLDRVEPGLEVAETAVEAVGPAGVALDRRLEGLLVGGGRGDPLLERPGGGGAAAGTGDEDERGEDARPAGRGGVPADHRTGTKEGVGGGSVGGGTRVRRPGLWLAPSTGAGPGGDLPGAAVGWSAGAIACSQSCSRERMLAVRAPTACTGRCARPGRDGRRRPSQSPPGEVPGLVGREGTGPAEADDDRVVGLHPVVRAVGDRAAVDVDPQGVAGRRRGSRRAASCVKATPQMSKNWPRVKAYGRVDSMWMIPSVRGCAGARRPSPVSGRPMLAGMVTGRPST